MAQYVCSDQWIFEQKTLGFNPPSHFLHTTGLAVCFKSTFLHSNLSIDEWLTLQRLGALNRYSICWFRPCLGSQGIYWPNAQGPLSRLLYSGPPFHICAMYSSYLWVGFNGNFLTGCICFLGPFEVNLDPLATGGLIPDLRALQQVRAVLDCMMLNWRMGKYGHVGHVPLHLHCWVFKIHWRGFQRIHCCLHILPVRFMTFPHRDQVALQGEANVGLSIMQSEFSIMQQRRVSCVGGRHTPYVTATGAVRMEVSFETFCSRVEMSRGGQAAWCLLMFESHDLVGAWGRIPLQAIDLYECIKLLGFETPPLLDQCDQCFFWDPKLMINIPNRDLASSFWMFRYFLEHELQMACWGFPDSFWADQTDISLSIKHHYGHYIMHHLYATVVSRKMSESFHSRFLVTLLWNELHVWRRTMWFICDFWAQLLPFSMVLCGLLSMPHSSWQDRKILAYTPLKDPGQV